MGATWLIGALMAATGSIASNLGVNCQKYSFMQNAKLPKALQKKHIRQKGWLFGMALVVLGAVGDFVALSLAAQSIVAPIGSITLVANVFFAHYWLKEQVGLVELIGTTMIVGGSVLAVTFGDHSELTYDIHQILSFFLGLTFIIYALLTISLATGLYRFQLPVTPVKQKIVDATRRYELAYDADDRQQMEYEDFYIASLQRSYSRYERIHPFTLCALSGILGGQSVMFGKMVSEMINVTANGDNQLFSPFFYLFIIAMLVCVVGQLQYLAIALSFFDALYVVPVFQCFFIGFSTLGGACFFNEFGGFSAVQAVVFPIGLLTTLGGVIVLTRRKMGDKDHKRLLLAAQGAQSDVETREEMEVIAEGDEQETADSEEKVEESEVIKMERRRKREERKRRRRLRRKQGYETLYDEDEDGLVAQEGDGESSEQETESEGEEQQAEETEYSLSAGRVYNIITTADTDKLEEAKSAQPPPSASPARESPVRQLSAVQPGHSPPASTTSTPSSRGSRPPSPPRPRGLTPLPAIEDLMGSPALMAPPSFLPTAAPVAPPVAVDRRSSMISVLPSTERRSSLERADRRASLPRRPSHSPRLPAALPPPPAGLLISTDDGTPPPPPAAGTASAPSTPPSLSRHPSLFRVGSVSPAAAAGAAQPLSFMQPSVSTYMPPPTGMDLWTKEEKIQDKVKKYSSLAHHAGGLVGVPIVSAIAHAWVIGQQEREEEKAEKRAVAAEQAEGKRKDDEKKDTDNAAAAAAAAVAAGADAHGGVVEAAADDGGGVEMSTIEPGHRYVDEYALPGGAEPVSVSFPVAEPVAVVDVPAGGGPSTGETTPFVHHARSGTIMGRLKDRIKLALKPHSHQQQQQTADPSDSAASPDEDVRLVEEGLTAGPQVAEQKAAEVAEAAPTSEELQAQQQPLISPGGRGSSDSELRLDEDSAILSPTAAEPSLSVLTEGDVLQLQEEEDVAEAEAAEKAQEDEPIILSPTSSDSAV